MSSDSSSTVNIPEVRLILLPKDPHGAESATFADEIVIYCQQGPAYKYENHTYYVLGLENIQTKERIPLLSNERIIMKIYDERDPYDGVRMLNRPGLTAAPWKNVGLVYFKAIEFCQVGQYRITFTLKTQRFNNGLNVKGLQYVVVATDPEWEAEQLNAILEDLNNLDKKTKDTSTLSSSTTAYAQRPLTKTEKDWLLSHSTHLPSDPPNHLLVQLAHDMHTALHTPAVKDITIIAPLFESETKRNARLQAEKEKKLMLAKHGMMIARLVMNEEKKEESSSSNTESSSSSSNTNSTGKTAIKGGYANLSQQAKKELLQRMQNELLGTTAPVLEDKETDTMNTTAIPSANDATDVSMTTSTNTDDTTTSSTVPKDSKWRKNPRKISHRGDDEGPYQPWHLADREHWNEAYDRARKWLTRYTEERNHWIEINRIYRAAIASGANEQERKKIVSRKLKGQSSDKIITRRSDCYRVHRFEGSIAAGETLVFMDYIALPKELINRWKISAKEWLHQAEEYRKNKLVELENDWSRRVAKAKKDYERRLLNKRSVSDTGAVLSPRASPINENNNPNHLMDIAESPTTIPNINDTDITMSTKDSPISTSLANSNGTVNQSTLLTSLSTTTTLSSSSSANTFPVVDISDFDENTMVKGKRPDLQDSALQQALLVEGFSRVSGSTVPYIQSLKSFLESRHPVLNHNQHKIDNNNNDNNNNRKRSRISKDNDTNTTIDTSSSTSTTITTNNSNTLLSWLTPVSIPYKLIPRSQRNNKKKERKIPAFIRRTDPLLGYPVSTGTSESVYTQIDLPPILSK